MDAAFSVSLRERGPHLLCATMNARSERRDDMVLYDKLTDRRWVECEECHGTGVDYCDGCYEEGPDGVGHGRCPDCIDGLTPPDDQVEAAAEGLFPWDIRTVLRTDWTERGIDKLAVTLARRALVAAAQKEFA